MLGNAEVAIHTEPCVTEMPTEKLVEKLATGVAGVKEVHEVNVAYAKSRLYITLHAYVDPKLSVEEAHEIAEMVEMRIEQGLRNVEDVAVHMEPLSLGKRRGAAVDEGEIRRIVHAVADSYQQAFRVKGIVTYVARRKRYINIDCSFTKQISIEETHEIASQIEEQVREHFAETTVTVHVEPS
jgi:divalent metal cation (Fe/Co/Zn/Cd) transporter